MNRLLYLALLVFSVPCTGQITFNSFLDLLRYADENSIAIAESELKQQIALSDKKEAGAGLLPTVSSSLGYNDNIELQPTLVPAQLLNPAAPPGAVEELTFGTQFQYSRGVTVQWDVLNFQKWFSVKVSKVNLNQSEVATEISRWNTFNQLAATYYSVLLSKESIEIYKKNVEVSAALLKNAQNKYDEGLMSEATFNLAKIRHLQNKSKLSTTQNNLDQFYAQLQSQLSTQKEIHIKDSVQGFTLSNTQIINQHPEVTLQELEVQKYEALVKQSKASIYPSLSLVYQNTTTWATNSFNDLSNATELPQQYLGLKLNFNFLDFTKRQKIKQSKFELELQEMELTQTVLAKQKEDELLQLQYAQSEDLLFNNKEVLELQAKNDVHAANKYREGLSSLDTRLEQYDQLLLAQDGYLQSLASLTLAKYKLFIRQMDFGVQ